MNTTLWHADRNTHTKIVAIALVAAIVVLAIGINARTSNSATASGTAKNVIVKAGQPATYATQEISTIR